MRTTIFSAMALVCLACDPPPTDAMPPRPAPKPSAAPTSEPPAPPICETPIDAGTACESVGDCWNSSQCDDDFCDLKTPPSPPDPAGRRGTCRYFMRPAGAPCDLPGHDTVDACVNGLCCAIGGAR